MSKADTTVPWHVGANGATNFTRHEAQRFARSLLESVDYRKSLEDRIKSKDLPPAVECMLWHYAYGKPVEQINMTIGPGQEDLSALTVDELLQRSKEMSERLEEAQALAAALPAEFVKDVA